MTLAMTKSSTIAPAFMVGTELSQSMLEIVTCLESMSKLNTTLVCFGTKKTVLNSTTTSCKSTWDAVPYFGINGLSMILCLWCPLHPLSKLLAIQDHTQNLEEQLWMGGRREVSIIFYRPVTRSDLKQERSFFRGSVSSFLQLVVALLFFKIEGLHFNFSKL